MWPKLANLGKTLAEFGAWPTSAESRLTGQLFGNFWTTSKLVGVIGGNFPGHVAGNLQMLGNFIVCAIIGLYRDGNILRRMPNRMYFGRQELLPTVAGLQAPQWVGGFAASASPATTASTATVALRRRHAETRNVLRANTGVIEEGSEQVFLRCLPF